ncbi:hypothetical protein AS188_03895 [Kocuria flava]|uniref:DUF2997 domain-containing protein n=1 Tax=Kocuria flava TaxID=446860 RepID=A0A0U3HN75_9MICC|nr:DUF2997 domain-containing protein [Kocuria flava]ALU39030.1 hypothetical protein AS188_03895 [Kocuria flava]GEO93085.1 hypothetical protein KFL01_23910 [Kocuria flava]
MTAPEPRQIVLRVDPDGAITAETRGMLGPSCLESIAVLEDLLEATTVHSTFTADYDRREGTIHTEVRHELRQQ